MFKIIKYLKHAKGSVAAIVLLLILQAYCELSLPAYTSDIVDVGIQNKGIADVAPEQMRASTFDALCMLMPEEDIQTVKENYTLNQEDVYVLNTKDREVIDMLDGILGQPMAGLLVMQQMPQQGQMPDVQTGGVENGAAEMDAAGFSESGLSDAMIEQMAIAFVQQEYEALGVDMAAYQQHYLLTTGGRMMALSVLMMAAAIAVGLIAARVSAGIGRDLRGQVFKRVLSFSDAEMNRFSTASLITRSTNDIQQVQMVCVMLLRIVAYAPIIGIGGVIKVAMTRTGMGWIIGVAVGAIIFLVAILMMVAMPKFKMMQKLVDNVNLVSREILTGIPVIRAFSREKYEEKRFDGANKQLMQVQLFTNRAMTFMMPSMMLIMNGITVMIVWFGAKGVDMGNLQVGDMMAFITYTMQIVMAFLMLTMISIMLPRAGVAAERIDEILRTESMIHDAEHVRDDALDEVKGVVTFDHVSFHYPDAEENVLEDIDFTAEPGKVTAIIGSTGCGKTTLVQLIPRFFDVTEGTVRLDGIDIREISQHKLREQLGYVPQKGVLFSGTIASNLKFAGERVSDEDMRTAAAIAQATEFIETKPAGYDSAIAQGGTNVSGGQKQRLSIARAIAHHPKVCIFDDSFSALDYKTDTALRKELNEKLSDATVIIVAQRISTILHADQIIVLDEGRIVGKGTHAELLASNGTYQEIARSQLSEAELTGGVA